jgi:glycine cleavage system H lipoate-binding protein
MQDIPPDLFATKGAEYLIVIAYLFLLIGFWRLLARSTAERATVALLRRVHGVRRVPKIRGWFRVPEGYYFHQGHSWAIDEPGHGGTVRVGMDDFSQRFLGRPEAFHLPRVGDRVKQGECGWEVEVESKSIPMLSPVEGRVVAVNSEISQTPELVGSDPYERGWLLKVQVDNAKAAFTNLLSGRLARAWNEATVDRLHHMQAGELGLLLPDGGVPVDGFVRVLAPDDWDEVARDFFLSN